ncbi:MAG: DNA starvation/stationary phase protection protein [Alphaproteobacteria bacterium]|nr:DNA starvation/stationary phase protection protein [Alphaproteobacteria bacterium]
MADVNIGLDGNSRKAVAEALNGVLADTYILYMKTHSYHWNVTGPQFHTLHVMFEEQYREMWAALDVIAERVRALGEFAPTSGADFANRSGLESADTEPPKATDMIKNLLADHESLVRRAREALETASQADDAATDDLITQRIQTHEKTAWMLRAMIS